MDGNHWLSGQNFDSRYDLYYCYSDVPPQPILGDTWVARYTSKRLHGYFSIIGVSVDASQENDKDNYELHFAPDHDGGKAYICGNNSDPFHARMVRETNP